MENNKTNYVVDFGFKTFTFKKGNHKYIEFTDYISGLTERYHLAIQEKIIASLSDYQLKRLIKLCNDELQRRKK